MTAGGRLLRALLLLAVLVRLVPVPLAQPLSFEAPVCHSDATPEPTPQERGAHDCALCPICLTAVVQAMLPREAAAPAATLAKGSMAWSHPPATGPPASTAFTPPPRGPPA